MTRAEETISELQAELSDVNAMRQQKGGTQEVERLKQTLERMQVCKLMFFPWNKEKGIEIRNCLYTRELTSVP